MTHLNDTLTAAELNAKAHLAEIADDEHGGLSIEWLALAAAVVAILAVVGTNAAPAIASAVAEAFESIAGGI